MEFPLTNPTGLTSAAEVCVLTSALRIRLQYLANDGFTFQTLAICEQQTFLDSLISKIDCMGLPPFFFESKFIHSSILLLNR